jgi:YVTN family beta-propeller protein
MNLKSRHILSAMVLTAVLSLTTASGQWFEGWISLPDSLTGVKQPECLAYDSATNTVWVGGRWSDRLLAVDSDSNKVVASVRLPGAYVRYLCSASRSHKVFGSIADMDTVVVVDCLSGTVLALIPVANPDLLFYSPTYNKVYCACDSGVAIIDAATNNVIRTLPVAATDFCEDTQYGWIYCTERGKRLVTAIDGASDDIAGWFRTECDWPTAVCYSTKSERVYCANDYSDTVTVAHRDTVLGAIRVGHYPIDVCYNSVNDKVYCANWGSGTVSVIRCDSSRVVKTISTGGSPEILVYDSLLNRVYCTTGTDIAVLDGQSDVVLDRIPNVNTRDALILNRMNERLYYPAYQFSEGVMAADAISGDTIRFIPTLGSEKPVTVSWNSIRNKVYVACQGSQSRLAVVSGSSGRVLGWVPTESGPCALVYDSVLDRIYSANNEASSVSVIDCGPDTTVAVVPVGDSPVALLCSSGGDMVYCVNRGSNSVSAIDAYLNNVSWTAQVGSGPCAIAYGASGTKLYCADSGSSRVTVLDPTSGGVLKTIQVGAGPRALAYSPASDRLYCVNVNSATVSCIDCESDSVIASVSVPGPYDIAYYPPDNRVLCSRVRLGGWIWYYAGIASVDCGTNQIAVDFDLAESGTSHVPFEFGHDHINSMMYVRVDDYTWGMSRIWACSSSGICKDFQYIGGFGGGFALNERLNRMYAACQDDSRIAVFRDVGGGIQDENTRPRLTCTAATIACGVLFLPEAPSRKPQAASLLDISGRKVLDLHPGANDVRVLAPGVYFIRGPKTEDGRPASTVRKVVLTE